MKKLLLIAATLLCALGMNATDFTGQLTVKINEDVARQQATITLVDNGDNTYSFSLNNFVLDVGTQKIGVGNIALPNLTGTEGYGFTNIATKQDVTITAGDDPEVPVWIGPGLGPVPVDLQAAFNDNTISVTIDIDMVSVLGQMIKVNFVAAKPATGGSTDVNGDGKTDVEDINTVINAVLGK